MSAAGSVCRRMAFDERTASAGLRFDPQMDIRAYLFRTELGEVNSEAARIARRYSEWSRAAVSRKVAREVIEAASMSRAVPEAAEAVKTASGTMVPIESIGDVDGSRQEVMRLYGL